MSPTWDDVSGATDGPPAARLLPEGAERVYLAVLEAGALPKADAAAALGETAASGARVIDDLAEMGLLVLDGDAVRPGDPRLVEATYGGAWRARAAEFLRRATALGGRLEPLTAAYRLAAHADTDPPIEYVEGIPEINERIDEALAECRSELLTAQPGGGRTTSVLESAVERDLATLARGVTMRTLYQHTARHSAATRKYVETILARGASVRTLDQLFERLLVIDRRIAFIPATADRRTAVIVRDPAVVTYLAGVFDRNWERADRFPARYTASSTTDVGNRLRQTIIRLLLAGETDSVIAKRVGFSERTCAAHIAKLKADLGAETRLQLGYLLARAGYVDDAS